MHILRICFFSVLLGAFYLVTPPSLQADVFGRVKIIATEADLDSSLKGSPVAGALVKFHDLSRARADISLKTDRNGLVISPLLENRTWVVSVIAAGYAKVSQEIKISSDTTSELRLVLNPIEETIRVSAERTNLKSAQTAVATSRAKEFSKTFPISAQNPQQLTGLLLSTPGFVADSANQVHPRGEHSASSVYIQGFQLGGAAQGRFGPTIDPQALESLDIMTGGFAPEYAGGAAILNTTVRSGTAKPFLNAELGAGTNNASMATVSLGGQAGQAISAPDSEGNQNKIFSYFINASGRSTDTALESPQPRNQSDHNRGESASILGRFDLNPTPDDAISLILNDSPAKTDVANRSGLPERYAPFGQGYGFGGALTESEAADKNIVSQSSAGQDIYQKDRNGFAVLQWRHTVDENLSSLFSIGADQSKLDTLNRNPEIDLASLPDDAGIEYNPTVRRDARHKQASGSVTYAIEEHTFKFGAQYSGESSDDDYQLIPASDLATNALFAADPRLTGAGAAQFDAAGNPLIDSAGNQIYTLSSGALAPKLSVRSRGYYLASYAQDTWKFAPDWTANYGLRFDKFHQAQSFASNGIDVDSSDGGSGDGGAGDGVDADQYSPRLNLSWNFQPTWILRTSYNRLFIEPPLSQGSIIGRAIQPSRVNQYDVSLQKEITARQVAKVAYYYKSIKNQVDTGLLIPSTQLGLFTSVNLDRAAVRGVEFSYDLLADSGLGTSAFVAYAYSVAQPSGFDNTGEPVEKYNDHDQRHTLSSGLGYTFNDRSSLGATYYFGSGLASSVLSEDANRETVQRVDLNIASAPDLLFNSAGLRLTVANLLDQRDLINFNSPFSGTRFQQGRSVMLSTFFSF